MRGEGWRCTGYLADRAGLEPATYRLTADRTSTCACDPECCCGKDESIRHRPTHLGPYQPTATLTVGCLIDHNWGCTGGAPSALPSHRSGIIETNETSVVCSSRYRSTWLGAYRNATGLRRIASCLFPCRGKLVPVTASGELWRRIGQFQCLLCVVAGAELRLVDALPAFRRIGLGSYGG